MSDIAIKVEKLSKVYKLYDKPIDRMKESLHPLRKRYHRDFYALNDVSFEIKKGETIGIIGKNGSGKSTLLKILTGVLTPTTGKVEVNGRVSALLELGAGFNPEFTGLENVYFNGSIMGYTREEMDARIDDILSFADIGDFINQPVKMYSSGMFVRLAFSVATVVDPEILIVDEALSVGDMFFQAKCVTRMKSMIENNGTTLLFVSHDIGSVKSLCKNAILLGNGSIVQIGDSFSVAERYLSYNYPSKNEDGNKSDVHSVPGSNFSIDPDNDLADMNVDGFIKTAEFQRVGNKKIRFHNVQLFDQNNKVVKFAEYNQRITLRMFVDVFENISNIGFAYHIINKNGVNIVYNDTLLETEKLLTFKNGHRYVISWSFNLSIESGDYTILTAATEIFNLQPPDVEYCDYIPIACQFNVGLRHPSPVYGAVYLKNDLLIEGDYE